MTGTTITPRVIDASPIRGKRVLLDKSQVTLTPGIILSACENEFLKRLAQGDSYNEIAAGMNVSINTVRDYVRAVYRKFDVDTRTKAVVKYLCANLESRNRNHPLNMSATSDIATSQRVSSASGKGW